MRLRAKTLLVVGLAMAALFALLFVFTRAQILADYELEERKSAIEDAQRLAGALQTESLQIDRLCRDWAARSATYRFVTGHDASFTQTELTEDALVNLGVNVLLIVAEDRSVRNADYVDLDLGVRTSRDDAVTAAILADTRLQDPADPKFHRSGILRTPRGPMLVAARSITGPDLYVPPAGTLILGRYLDAGAADRFSQLARLPVKVFDLAAEDVPRDVLRANNAIGDGTLWSAPQADGSLSVYSLVRDLSGAPAAVLRVVEPRVLRAHMIESLRYVALALSTLGLAATAIVYGLVDRGVLRRIALLSDEVGGIGERADPARRVVVRGRDEIGMLASGMNEMLANIEDAERELQKARSDLEVRVEHRTEELAASERRYRLLVEHMADAIFSVDLAGTVTLANDCACELTGLREEELLGRSFSSLLDRHASEKIARWTASSASKDFTWTIEAGMGTDSRDRTAVELRGTSVLGENGAVIGTQWIAHNITQRKRFELELVRMASHDYLTGLHNRRAFEEALDQALADYRRGGNNGAVVWLDLDDFKDVNDSFGHMAGDEVLVTVADQLRKQVRETDLLARLGGDEFAVLLPRTTRREAEAAAERILNAINTHTCSLQGHAVRVSASLGLVMYPMHGSTTQDLLANADAAMYQAKSTGRSQIYMHRFEKGLQDEMRSRVQWNERITRALRKQLFLVYAQPVLDLHTGVVSRHELLIRLNNEDGTLSMPSEFLPVAERLGLVNDIDAAVIGKAVDLLAMYRGEDLCLDVNLSGKAFADSRLLDVIEHALYSAHVQPSHLGIEITETAAIADMAKAKDFISRLKEIGCRISLDDFGSGFSSFYYLKHLPIDCLKIDGSFIRSLQHNEKDRHLVRGLVELCRGMNLDVAAEYVEDAVTLDIVKELGVDRAQGFYIGRPVPAEEAIATAIAEAAG